MLNDKRNLYREFVEDTSEDFYYNYDGSDIITLDDLKFGFDNDIFAYSLPVDRLPAPLEENIADIKIINRTAATVQIQGLFAIKSNVDALASSATIDFYVNNESGSGTNLNLAVATELLASPIITRLIKVSADSVATLRSLTVEIEHRGIFRSKKVGLFSPQRYMTENQFQNDVVTIPRQVKLNGLLGWNFTLPANAYVIFTIEILKQQPNTALLDAWVAKEIKRGNIKIEPVRPGIRPSTSTK
ncbi:MAG: hypothetical protein ABIL45_04285 [candidate division WOR-3 bacterium]